MDIKPHWWSVFRCEYKSYFFAFNNFFLWTHAHILRNISLMRRVKEKKINSRNQFLAGIKYFFIHLGGMCIRHIIRCALMRAMKIRREKKFNIAKIKIRNMNLKWEKERLSLLVAEKICNNFLQFDLRFLIGWRRF